MQNQEPMVSVLVPVYNRENYIEECVQSALTQTASNLEVVICDNASTDHTFEICSRIAQQDERVRLFRNETNVGPLNNWIRCIEEANGVYGKILFSDDLMYPGYLSACLPFMKSEEVGMVFSAVDLGTQSAGARPWYAWTGGAGVVASEEFVHDSLFSGNVPYSPGAFLFRLADIRRFLLVNPPYRVGERYAAQGMGPDLGLCLLTARAYRYVAHVPDPLVLFRIHPGSFTESAGMKTRLWNYNRVRKAILDQAGDRKQLRRWLAWSWLTFMAASRPVMGLSEHLKDLDVEEANLRPRLEDIFWAGSMGMWPMLVRQSRHFGFLGQIGARKNLPVPTTGNVA